MQLTIKKATKFKEIKEKIREIFNEYGRLLPSNMGVSILLKPNLNANMNALTGNTTDLRILSSVIQALYEKGYHNITIGEGTNSGYYRNNISVISRLKVDRLAKFYGVKVIDLNYSDPYEISFENGVKACVAREVVESDFFINLPKLKTHFEAGMTVCLKNLMGCLIGQTNKKKTHKSLAENILHINEHVKPHLHIVDGIIAMEGLGPTRGTPIKTGIIIAGTDPYLIDLACAKIAGFNYRKVRTLKTAEEKGKLTAKHHAAVDAQDVKGFEKKFAPPEAGPLAAFIHHPSRQKYFLAIRNTALFNYLCSTKIAGKILYATGLRQDVFIDKEMSCKGLSLNRQKCAQCGKCMEYCPVDIELPNGLEKKENGCIHCLYCYLVCPKRAIEFKGELGFMGEQIRQYDEIIRKIA
jgi:uncharacterized protein (DUF362 family)/NAD-dependent dihydropyrimidine dehydrogenase PreA subunit